MSSKLLEGLNDKQTEAVQYTEGPLLILAGAGSGKTRVLTHRVGYILENGLAQPWQILAITFTNKAAGEMRERVDRLLPGQGQDVFVSTFHSMCVRMLRRDIDRLGYDRDFTIYDTDDQKTLMRQVVKDLKMDPKQYRERGMLTKISSLKNEMVSASNFEVSALDFHERNIAKIYQEYETRLQKNNALDFDDLLLKTTELFGSFPEVLAYWQNRFRYCMVDEYQDTNSVQFEIVRMLTEKSGNLCVVGDDDQSIYKFRGANIENILSFEKSFPGAKVIKLEQNYRSTKSILHAANEVIRHNTGRKSKTLWTDNEEGEKPVFTEYETAAEEAERTVRAVKSSLYPLREQAILYRTNAQSRILEEKCIAANVPYTIVGGVNFYQRKEIKDILSYLRIIANGVDDLACERIINVPKRGIGDTTVGRVRDYAFYQGISLYDALCQPDQIPGINQGTAAKLNRFTDMIEDLRERVKKEEVDLKTLVEAVRDETGYAEELRKEEDPTVVETRLENIEELISKAVDFTENDRKSRKAAGDTQPAGEETKEAGTLPEMLGRFLEEVSLIADIDRTDDTEDLLTMMTLHGAKGLEFNKVYLCGMEEGLFPSSASIYAENPEEEVEEERRLCYVGMTRAKKELVMSSARMRMSNGETKYAAPSRFVDELPEEGVEIHRKPVRSSASEYYDRGDYGDGPSGFRKSWTSDFGSGSVSSYGSSSYGSSGSYGNVRRGGYDGGFGGSFGGGYGSLQYQREQNVTRHTPSLKNDAFRKGSAIEKKEPEYRAGDRVSHIKFGEGTVLKIEEEAKDYKVTVEFDGFGTKVMLAGFAKLEKI